jgi:chromate reductase
VVGATTGAYGAVWAQAELRKVLGATGARVAPVEVAVAHAHERFNEDGVLLDDEIRAGLAEALRELIQSAQPIVVAA